MSRKLPPNLNLKIFRGNQAKVIFEDLAWLRIQIFKSYPYLYLGETNYEKKYLERYFNSPSFFVAAIYEQNQIIGATTALKLSEESEDIKSPIGKANFDIESFFYFGESLLLEKYRGLGIGHLFFDLREQHALQFSEVKSTLFCSVVRNENHPLKPKSYVPHNPFWHKRGYQPLNIFCELSWKDIDENFETAKPLQFWKKDWL